MNAKLIKITSRYKMQTCDFIINDKIFLGIFKSENMQEVTNFARFYSILKRVPKMGGEDFAKRELSSIGTDGRTEAFGNDTGV